MNNLTALHILLLPHNQGRDFPSGFVNSKISRQLFASELLFWLLPAKFRWSFAIYNYFIIMETVELFWTAYT